MALLYEQETYNIIGASMNVHKALGPGFLESVYMEALEKEFFKLKIPFQKNKRINVKYDGEVLQKYFNADFICYDLIIVEMKASSFLHFSNRDQTINYLKATGYKVGLLVNFGQPSLTWKRFINT